VRLSRSRVLLRAALLLIGGVFMLVKAWEARGAAASDAGPGRLLLERVALVEALVGILAVAAAGMALLALRRQRRGPSLRLRDLEPPRNDAR
jgi:hypothetical protein